MNQNDGAVSYQWLEEIVARCSNEIQGYPANRYLVRFICQQMIDEYDGPFTSARYEEHQGMRGAIDRALTDPGNGTLLDELVRTAINHRII